MSNASIALSTQELAKVRATEGLDMAVEALSSQLLTNVDAAASMDCFKQFLKMQASQYNYSFNNVLLAWAQLEARGLGAPKYLASYEAWQKLFKETGNEAAYITKGAGLKILVPTPKIVKPAEKDEAGNETKPAQKKLWFKWGHVYDISGVENFSIEDVPDYRNEQSFESSRYESVLSSIKSMLTGWEFTFEPDAFLGFESECKGYCSPGRKLIAVRGEMSTANKLRTLLHEAAHAMLHAGDKDFAIEALEAKHTRSSKELEAESVSFIVATHLGLDADDSKFYLAAWAKSETPSKEMAKSMSRISKCAKEIILKIGG